MKNKCLQRKILTTILPTTLISAPSGLLLAGPAGDFTYITDFFVLMTIAIGNLVPVVIGLALLVFIWGLVVFIAQSDNEQARTEGKQKMIWGIITLFVVACVWGLVRLVQIITGVNGASGTLAAPGVPSP